MMGIKKLTAENISAVRKRLLKMHFDSGAGHVGGNVSALDAMLVIFHEYFSGKDKFIFSAGALCTTLWSLEHLQK